MNHDICNLPDWLRAVIGRIFLWLAAKIRGHISLHEDIMMMLYSELRQGVTILEIGCGGGFLTRKIRSVFIGVAEFVLAIDKSRVKANSAAHHCLCESNETGGWSSDDGDLVIETVNSYMLQPLKNDQVHVAVCAMVMNSLEDWERLRVIEEIYRVLEPGGFVIFADHRTPKHWISKLHRFLFYGPAPRFGERSCLYQTFVDAETCGFVNPVPTDSSIHWIGILTLQKPVNGKPSRLGLGLGFSRKLRKGDSSKKRKFRRGDADWWK